MDSEYQQLIDHNCAYCLPLWLYMSPKPLTGQPVSGDLEEKLNVSQKKCWPPKSIPAEHMNVP